VGKNVAVFVDVANIFYAAKAAGVDIDYVTMLKSATAGRDLVRAYAYTGLDPDNENQRNFHDFLRRSNYKVVSKDIRKYGDGKVKANLDIELVVDMMKTARNLDIAIVVSGDGDFAPAIRAVQEMGVRVEVISFRGNTSSDLIEVADLFTDIVQIARVEKGTGRSGRRVATDDEDLSMTEVPDKQTEGTGAGRSRGRGTGRSRTGEGERVAAPSRAAGRGRARVEPAGVPVAASAAASETPTASRAGLVALPGEKLSRAAAGAAPAPAAAPVDGDVADVADLADEDLPDDSAASGVPTGDGEEPRRRRRRGGRGRGRGRGRDGEPAGDATDAVDADGDGVERPDRDEPVKAPLAPRVTRPAAAAFGSVWDSQLPAARTPAPRRDIPVDEEFDDEPAIPEYLIAERRGNQRSGARPVGGRGGARAGYSAAVDRERFGRGGGGGGINRYPDVSARTVQPRDAAPRDNRGGGRDAGRRDERGFGRGSERPERTDRIPGAPRPGEGWSEVPPELEAMLRAQLAAGGAGSGPRRDRSPVKPASVVQPAETAASTDTTADAGAAPRRRTGRATGEAPAKAVAARSGRRAGAATEPVADAATGAVATPKPRVTRSRASAPEVPVAVAEGAAAPGEVAPKRRSTRTKAAGSAASSSGDAPSAGGDGTGTEPAAPKRRTTRAKATTGEA